MGRGCKGTRGCTLCSHSAGSASLMLKVILFLLAGAVVILLAWVLASIPGHVVASIGAFTIETSTPMAILMLVALFVVTFILMRILRGILAIPRSGADWRRRHRLT